LGVNVVQVDVSVLDDTRRRVRDLTAADFTVYSRTENRGFPSRLQWALSRLTPSGTSRPVERLASGEYLLAIEARPARGRLLRRRPVPEVKTKKTTASVQAFLKKVAKGDRYEACRFLLATFEKAARDKAAMWGTGIVGVGAETMTYANGDQIDWPIGGFSPRAQNIAIYGMKASPRHAALMKKIGKAKMGGGCMYIKSLDGVDQKVLAELITTAIQAKAQRYPSRAKATKKA